MSIVQGFSVVRLSLPLIVPYKLSYRTFTEFEPFIVQVQDDDGRIGFGEGHISPGSSTETREGGWKFLMTQLPRLKGRSVADAIETLTRHVTDSPVAATAAVTALEMLRGHPLLERTEKLCLPLLSPVNASSQSALEPELEGRLKEGFGTFKIKVGLDVEADLKRVELIQSIVHDRASLRIDANRAYSCEDAIRFATSINPDRVELFEQPCAAEDWDANAAVAQVSRVPLMLDEPICSNDDIRRAEGIEGVGYCKVKLKRFGGIDALREAIALIRACGMQAVLGDGLGGETACWMEACVAADSIDNAGEFNGYLKSTTPIFQTALGFNGGSLIAPESFRPQLDVETLAKATTDQFTVGAFVKG